MKSCINFVLFIPVADKDAAFDLLLLLTFRHRVRTSNSS
jgi:hypothetical protein